MGQKTVRYSDLSEQLITEDSDLVRIVVHERPELDSHGRITDAEKRLVREHLAEVNKRLAAEGLRTIDPADPALAERYGIEGDAGSAG